MNGLQYGYVAPVVGQQYTFEPERCGVTLDQVTFGPVLRAQGRAWLTNRGKGDDKEEEEKGWREEASEKRKTSDTAIKSLKQ